MYQGSTMARRLTSISLACCSVHKWCKEKIIITTGALQESKDTPGAHRTDVASSSAQSVFTQRGVGSLILIHRGRAYLDELRQVRGWPPTFATAEATRAPVTGVSNTCTGHQGWPGDWEVAVVGECGLDYDQDSSVTKRTQKLDVFALQFCAQESGSCPCSYMRAAALGLHRHLESKPGQLLGASCFHCYCILAGSLKP
jgi:Tat protein secretion system quality control protein TatD with DNase activity